MLYLANKLFPFFLIALVNCINKRPITTPNITKWLAIPRRATNRYHLKTQLKWEYVTNWLGCVARSFSKPFQAITKPHYINIVESQYLLWKPHQQTERNWKIEKHENSMRERQKTNNVNNFESTCHWKMACSMYQIEQYKDTWMNLYPTTVAPGKKDWWLKLTISWELLYVGRFTGTNLFSNSAGVALVFIFVVQVSFTRKITWPSSCSRS